MVDDRWDVPQTEEGFRALLVRLAESRAAGDDLEVGRGLLKLAHLVKWVRSDNEEPPFDRSRTLALEALAIFRRLDDARGKVAALLAAAPLVGPDERARMSEEAAELARASGDELLIARSLADRGRAMGLSDRAASVSLTREALAIFLRLDERVLAAGCLFSLAIQAGTRGEKYESAVESARLYREAGRSGDAARSVTLAVMNGEESLSFGAMEPLIRQGLADAQAEGSRSLEGIFYGHLAKVAEEKGDAEEAAKFRRWREDLKESDGLTPRQRRRGEIEMAKAMIALAKTQENEETAKMFRKRLRQLRRPTFFR